MKIFLSDLDGTLLQHDQSVHQEDIQAIKFLHQKGVQFGIATGRDYGFCKNLMKQYDLPIEIMILNNGGSVFVKEQRILEMNIEREDVRCILTYLKPYVGRVHPFICDENSSFYMMKNSYSCDGWKDAKALMAYLGDIKDMDILDIIDTIESPIIKLSLCICDEKETPEFLSLLQSEFSNSFEVLQTSSDYIEFTKKGVHKGSALLILESHLSLNRNDVSFIGDGENDISLMDLAGYSYVMDSANDIVKHHGNKVVASVAEAIKDSIK